MNENKIVGHYYYNCHYFNRFLMRNKLNKKNSSCNRGFVSKMSSFWIIKRFIDQNLKMIQGVIVFFGNDMLKKSIRHVKFSFVEYIFLDSFECSKWTPHSKAVILKPFNPQKKSKVAKSWESGGLSIAYLLHIQLQGNVAAEYCPIGWA